MDGATTVPSSYLGPGQEWSVEVVISDGEATVLSSAAVLVENAPPVAEITILTDSLYAGERAVLTGINSADPTIQSCDIGGLGLEVVLLELKHPCLCHKAILLR